MHDHVRRTVARLESPLDQFRSALGEHLNGDVVGDGALLDDLANEVKIRLACRREADLDLLVSHPHQEVEHPALAGRTHRVDEGLVAVAQVDSAPQWGVRDYRVRPGATFQVD